MKLLIGIILSLLLMTTPVIAEVIYNEAVGQWRVRGERHTNQHSFCSLETHWHDKSSLRFILDINDSEFYMVYTNPVWNLGNPSNDLKPFEMWFFKGPEGDGFLSGSYNINSINSVAVRHIDGNQILPRIASYKDLVLEFKNGYAKVSVGLNGANESMKLLADCLNNFK
jgi:hypothetical protein